MKYKYEMHQHTAVCSHCGSANPALIAPNMMQEGFAGVVITDHFLHGNTGIDRGLPWTEFCKAYEENYLRAKEVGDQLGFDVLFGLEEHVGHHKEVLLYGITPAFMYEYPEIADGELATLSRCAHKVGAVVIQAHPFRARSYIPDPDLLLDASLLDGYEIWNAANPDDQNQKAADYAARVGGILTAGSDCHGHSAAYRFGIETDKRIKTEAELAAVLKSGAYSLYHQRPEEKAQ